MSPLEKRMSVLLSSIKSRCKDDKNPNYGGKDIKCLITKEELLYLWSRDDAGKMKKPSIDRRKSDKSYTFKNCRFIEWEKNQRRVNRDNIQRESLGSTSKIIFEIDKKLKLKICLKLASKGLTIKEITTTLLTKWVKK